MHMCIYRVESLNAWMLQCPKRRRHNIYRDAPTPKWQQFGIYGVGGFVIAIISFWLLRDTTPVQFIEPVLQDLSKPIGDMVTSGQLNNVHWRVSIRYIGEKLAEVCREKNHTILTHKNILLDSNPMRESYIYMCDEKGDMRSVLNARAVVSRAAKKTAHCIETYAGVEKRIPRGYPFSLKYISTDTFTDRTKVIRDPVQACKWQHAIDIVNSVWN